LIQSNTGDDLMSYDTKTEALSDQVFDTPEPASEQESSKAVGAMSDIYDSVQARG
jgi:hypothetical protein